MVRTTLYLSKTLFLVILADIFFFEQTMGWTYGLFALLVLLALPASRSAYYRLSSWPGPIALGLIAAMILNLGALAISLLFIVLVTTALWHNMRHSQDFDFTYLEEMDPKALSALTWLSEDRTQMPHASQARRSADRLTSRLQTKHGNWRTRSIRHHLHYREYRAIRRD